MFKHTEEIESLEAEIDSLKWSYKNSKRELDLLYSVIDFEPMAFEEIALKKIEPLLTDKLKAVIYCIRAKSEIDRAVHSVLQEELNRLGNSLNLEEVEVLNQWWEIQNLLENAVQERTEKLRMNMIHYVEQIRKYTIELRLEKSASDCENKKSRIRL